MYMNMINKISLFMKINRITIMLILIVFLAAFLRVYRLDQIPPSLNWDEAAAGYNAYTIANWGRDEWGHFFPLVFTSFQDDKHPVHIYLSAPIIKLFGLSDFTARLTSAIIGILSVLIIFYLARLIFGSDLAALLSALFLAVSPYAIHFSRGLWEANFAVFFFLLGLLMFYQALQRRGWLINVSFLSFGISILSYHSSKVVIPPVVLLLVILYFKNLKKLSINFYTALFIFFVFITLLFIDPRLTGFARLKQTQFEQSDIERTQIYQKTKNPLLGLGEIALKGYFAHFTTDYLFISGDPGPRNSDKVQGEFYKIDALFLFVGLLYLLKLRSRPTLIILAWLALAPIPSALVKGAPNADRAIFMIGSMHLIAGLGAASIVNWFKLKFRYIILTLLLILLFIQVYSFLNYYFNVYPKKDSIDWQYGMEQIVDYVKAHPDYGQVYMTDIRSQPYIFFLFYLKTNVYDFLRTVSLNDSETKSFSTVAFFEKYFFGGWDPVESMPISNVLYVVSPSQYGGLRHRTEFKVEKVVHYLDGADAFYLVTGK